MSSTEDKEIRTNSLKRKRILLRRNNELLERKRALLIRKNDLLERNCHLLKQTTNVLEKGIVLLINRSYLLKMRADIIKIKGDFVKDNCENLSFLNEEALDKITKIDNMVLEIDTLLTESENEGLNFGKEQSEILAKYMKELKETTK